MLLDLWAGMNVVQIRFMGCIKVKGLCPFRRCIFPVTPMAHHLWPITLGFFFFFLAYFLVISPKSSRSIALCRLLVRSMVWISLWHGNEGRGASYDRLQSSQNCGVGSLVGFLSDVVTLHVAAFLIMRFHLYLVQVWFRNNQSWSGVFQSQSPQRVGPGSVPRSNSHFSTDDGLKYPSSPFRRSVGDRECIKLMLQPRRSQGRSLNKVSGMLHTFLQVPVTIASAVGVKKYPCLRELLIEKVGSNILV